MQLIAHARVVATELKAGLKTFLRGALTLLRASRLAEALAYGLAVIFALFPISFVGQFLNWALARDSVWVGVTVVTVATVFLILSAALMTNEQFLRDVHLQGIQWPSLLSIALAWFAVVVFGGLSCGLERLGIVRIAPSVHFTDGCATRYADMYLWSLFNSIPGIEFTDTIRWKQRYEYSDALSGWLMLSFKVLVLVSVIRSFIVCGRLRREVSAAGGSAKSEAA